jgi:NADPH-dependent glutamate synthase beta subunit-like oxidoreductase
VKFETGVVVGDDLSERYLRRNFDAILLAMGAGEPRGLNVMGAAFDNVHTAMDFLVQQNRLGAGDPPPAPSERISAQDKCVVVIGGGDTGSDCVGTSLRQGAREVHQLEILPKPPEGHNPMTPWPMWPQILRTSTSHEEGCQRRWGVLTKRLSGKSVRANQLHGVEVQWASGPRGWEMEEIPGTEFKMPVDLVLLAMGFLHVVHGGLVESLGLNLDQRGNVAVDDYMTSEEGVFAAGDTTLGASLVVSAIEAGREAAQRIDTHLMGQSLLPSFPAF